MVRSRARSGRGGAGSGRAAFGGAFSSAFGAAFSSAFGTGVGAGRGGAGAFATGPTGSGLPKEGVAGTRFTMYTFD